ncbi:MAG TPA: transposase [Candidatus Omnitrophica bacterium]|nr:transposase [Candidatus Omnitrophota bacterium]
MKLTLQLRLLPDAAQRCLLLTTMEHFNAAATHAARVGFEAKVYSQPPIHHRCYRDLRERFGLSAQMAVRAIGKAVEVFRRDKTRCPIFKLHGAMTYDQRLMSFKGMACVSLLTLEGRQLVPLVFGEYQRARFDRIKGQCDLVYRRGKFFLYASIDLPPRPPVEITDFLGVDLGVANLAVDSDGRQYSGAPVEKIRQRHHRLRQRLQRVNTKGGRKKLKRLAGREARFRRHQNHVIAKTLVTTCKDTGRGLALENLQGVRERTRFRRPQRARMAGWAFGQLRAFLQYKAALAGIPVAVVDPRNTSRTCSRCGHCEPANRKHQATFVCRHCAFSSHADINAAQNIGLRATCKPAPELARLTA